MFSIPVGTSKTSAPDPRTINKYLNQTSEATGQINLIFSSETSSISIFGNPSIRDLSPIGISIIAVGKLSKLKKSSVVEYSTELLSLISSKVLISFILSTRKVLTADELLQ